MGVNGQLFAVVALLPERGLVFPELAWTLYRSVVTFLDYAGKLTTIDL
jgi:hypothetical protein